MLTQDGYGDKLLTVTTTGQDHWELAGMTDEDGVLVDAFLRPPAGFPPAYAELGGDRLYYKPGPSYPEDSAINPKGILDAFVRIRDGKDIVRFARRYGVLGICEHGRPAAHSRACDPLGREEYRWWDPIDRWLAYVAQARAILDIAAKLYREKPVKPADWQPLDELVSWLYPEGFSHEIQDHPTWNNPRFQRAHVSVAVAAWVDLADARPRLTWRDEKPSILLRPDRRVWTFGVLAVQLMMAVGRAHAIALCDGCGQPYLRLNRAPQRGRPNYCPECRGKVAAMLRKRAQRARKKGT